MIKARRLGKDMVRYSTIIKVDNVYLNLWVDKLIYYSSDEDLKNPDFEKTFYWPLEKMSNKAFNHISYNQIVGSDYSKQSGGDYELKWRTIILNKITGGISVSLIEDGKINSSPIAIPLTKDKRVDYILEDFSYVYNSQKDIKLAIKICIEDNKFEIA